MSPHARYSLPHRLLEFSSVSNWTWNFFVVMVTGPLFQNIGFYTYVCKFLALDVETPSKSKGLNMSPPFIQSLPH